MVKAITNLFKKLLIKITGVSMTEQTKLLSQHTFQLPQLRCKSHTYGSHTKLDTYNWKQFFMPGSKLCLQRKSISWDLKIRQNIFRYLKGGRMIFGNLDTPWLTISRLCVKKVGRCSPNSWHLYPFTKYSVYSKACGNACIEKLFVAMVVKSGFKVLIMLRTSQCGARTLPSQ